MLKTSPGVKEKPSNTIVCRKQFKMYTKRQIFTTVFKCASAAILLYLIVIIYSTTRATHILRQLQQSLRNRATLDPQQAGSVEADRLELLASQDIFQGELLTAVERAEMNAKLDRVKKLTKCLDKPLLFQGWQRGDYWVLYNYVQAKRQFKCHESITYTTHADYSLMGNLVPLLKRWQGPLSIALYAPGTDFKNTLDSIGYLRDCTDSLVKEFVTFHVYFGRKHVPNKVSVSFFLIFNSSKKYVSR